MNEFPLSVPTYKSKDKTWDVTIFETKREFTIFVQKQFKVPSRYKLRGTKDWRQEAAKFDKDEAYTDLIPDTPKYERHWKTEKQKVINGIIVDKFYIPGFYYFYLNYCPIYNRKKKTNTFPSVFDSDYHFFLYLTLCILIGKHAVVVKTRQRGYSYKIMAVLIWSYWWFKGSRNTIGASDEEFTQKSWEYANNYRDHLNSHTAWIRGPFGQAKNLDWIEKQLTDEGREVGNKSSLKGLTFHKSPTKGVGGAQSFFFYEEAGIAPTLMQTMGYIRPAVEMGNITTGTIIISGSVGELDHCVDLKKIFESPISYNFLGVSNIWDENSTHQEAGFFVPESWSLEGFIDEEGNSLVDEAVAFIQSRREKSKEDKSGEEYQLEISQSPLTPSEAFAYRTKSFFPQLLITKQQERITIEKPKIKPVILFEDSANKVKWRFATDNDPRPIKIYPLPDSVRDVRGCVEILEFPITDDPPYMTYFAGVDPVSVDKTSTSDSLCSITIFKTMVEEKSEDEEGKEKITITGFKPVAWWVGRYDDLKENNDTMEFLIRMYNAFTIIESNVQTFINHMQGRKLQRYMATKKEIGFLEDLNTNREVHKVYGVHMNPTVKAYILQNIKDYMQEELDVVRKPSTDEIVRRIYGVERIQDQGLLAELKMYREGLNTDRCLTENNLVLTEIGYKKIKDIEVEDLVLSHDGTYQRVYKKLETKKDNLSLYRFKILGNSDWIESTENHPFLVSTIKNGSGAYYFKYRTISPLRWEMAKDIKKNDYFLIPKRANLIESKLDKELLYFLGWYLSDGYLTRGKHDIRICFQEDQIDLANQLKSIIEKYDDFGPSYNEGYNTLASRNITYKTVRKVPRVNKVKDKRCYNLEFSSKIFSKLIRDNVEILEGGEKILKPHLFNCNNLLPLILGFIEGDGHQKQTRVTTNGSIRHTIEFAGTYIQLIRQIRRILLDNNIWNTECLNRYSIKKPNFNDQLRIDIQDQIGINKILNSLDLEYKKFSIIEVRKQHQIHKAVDEGILVPIKKSELISRDTTVYNLEVENTHSYTCYNIVSHNCISFGLALSLAKYYVMNGLFTKIDKREVEKVQIKTAPARGYFKTLDNQLNPVNITRPRSYFKTMS